MRCTRGQPVGVSVARSAATEHPAPSGVSRSSPGAANDRSNFSHRARTPARILRREPSAPVPRSTRERLSSRPAPRATAPRPWRSAAQPKHRPRRRRDRDHHRRAGARGTPFPSPPRRRLGPTRAGAAHRHGDDHQAPGPDLEVGHARTPSHPRRLGRGRRSQAGMRRPPAGAPWHRRGVGTQEHPPGVEAPEGAARRALTPPADETRRQRTPPRALPVNNPCTVPVSSRHTPKAAPSYASWRDAPHPREPGVGALTAERATAERTAARAADLRRALPFLPVSSAPAKRRHRHRDDRRSITRAPSAVALFLLVTMWCTRLHD